MFNPMYHIEFQYRQKTCNFWVHGRDAGRRSGDPLPVDRKAKANAGAAWWTAVIRTIVVPVVACKYHEQLTGTKLAIAVIAVLAAWLYSIVKYQIIDGSVASRQKALDRRLAMPDMAAQREQARAQPAARVVAPPAQAGPAAAPAVAVGRPDIAPPAASAATGAEDERTLVLVAHVPRRPPVLVARP